MGFATFAFFAFVRAFPTDHAVFLPITTVGCVRAAPPPCSPSRLSLPQQCRNTSGCNDGLASRAATGVVRSSVSSKKAARMLWRGRESSTVARRR